MTATRLRQRSGITMVETALLLVILAVMFGVVLMAIPYFREISSRTQCTDRLRELGRACKAYEEYSGFLPADDPEQKRSFLWQIREYLEIEDGPPDSPYPPAAQFLCPSRRTVADLGQSDGPSDYGCGKHPGKYRSILAGPKPTTTVSVSNTGGTSNKLFMGHLGVRPSEYRLGVESGQSSWATGPLSRDPSQFVFDDDELSMNSLLGGPHPKASPFLFADGSVRRIPGYSPELTSKQLMTYWAFQDRSPIPSQYLSK